MPPDLDRRGSALLIFVKYPEPGKVKTRLAAIIGAELAAQLYIEFIHLTLELAMQIEVAARFVTFTPAEKEQQLQELFPGPWQWFPQVDSLDLGRRIHHAITYVQRQGYSRVLAIGTDSPSLPPKYLHRASKGLSRHDLVLGPAADGGYYLIGLKTASPELFADIEWSTEKVLRQTLHRAAQLRMSVYQLPPWYDVDDLSTLRRFCIESKQLSPDLQKKIKPFLE